MSQLSQLSQLVSIRKPALEGHSFALLEETFEERSKPVPSRRSGQALSKAKGKISLPQRSQKILRFAQNDTGSFPDGRQLGGGLFKMLKAFRRATRGEVWDGCTPTIENGKEPGKSQRGLSPGQGQGHARLQRRFDNPEVFEDFAGQIGRLWLMISLG